MSKNDDLTLRTPIWSTKAKELLAEQEWVDGLEFFRAVAKAIPPGVALRKAELIRSAGQRRRKQEDSGRKIERSQSMLIAAGRRAITQSMVSTRRRQGKWEIAPWPLPGDAWLKGGWRIRDARAPYIPVTVAMRELSTTAGVLRELAAVDPPVQILPAGPRKGLIHRKDMPELERRLNALWADRATVKLRAGMAKEKTQPWYTVTDLDRMYGLSTPTLRKFHAANPQLPLIHSGRVTRILAGDMPEWEKTLLDWVSAEHARRVTGSRMGAGRRKDGETPSFEDPDLDASATAYLTGESGPEQMHADMRRVYQDLDADDAAAAESEDTDDDEEDLDAWDDEELATLVDDKE